MTDMPESDSPLTTALARAAAVAGYAPWPHTPRMPTEQVVDTSAVCTMQR